MNDSRQAILYLVAACTLVLAAISLGNSIGRRVHTMVAKPVTFGDSATIARFAFMDSVVTINARNQFFEYTGGFENPFRLWNTSATPSDKKADNSTADKNDERVRLTLKGILIKDKSLAILENDRGETFIRGTGETVLEQKIVAISAQSVTLRDKRGTYEITVEDKR